MKRLPKNDELRDTIEEIGRELGKLSAYDLDRVIAAVEARIWECKEDAINALGDDKGDFYAGGIYYLDSLLTGLTGIAHAKARQN